ncbi:hypothetical protein [Ferrimonas marina]|uniref:Killing trait domain-containing protein n=1 Tax=Ferrimonas marina TaxID=299255 RepID=A0A1M5TF71_9GAMM|nr:hypothetical protein [Ferrimonas marina]SHH49382.1 hypothetical protein SAMN02745129_2120 [Ferrimonas marina]
MINEIPPLGGVLGGPIVAHDSPESEQIKAFSEHLTAMMLAKSLHQSVSESQLSSETQSAGMSMAQELHYHQMVLSLVKGPLDYLPKAVQQQLTPEAQNEQ